MYNYSGDNMLDKIDKKIMKCSKCPNLEKLKFATVYLGGNTEYLFIGESPAKTGWIKTGRAFYNSDNKLLPTGKVLNELLKIIDLDIDKISFTEACKCHIPDRKILAITSINCYPFLIEQIEAIKPKYLIPLGEHPTRILLELQKKDKFSSFVGGVYDKKIGKNNYKIVPIYHPSPINPKGYKLNVPIFEMLKESK